MGGDRGAPRCAAPRRGRGRLVRLGVPEHLARLLGATPALRASWLLGCALVLAFAAWAATRRADGLVVFLMLAPLLPVAGVAAAFGPDVDPSYEIGLAAPMRSFGLLLLRALAVLVTTTVMAGIAALALPGLQPSAAAWLLPSLGLTLASIALGEAFEFVDYVAILKEMTDARARHDEVRRVLEAVGLGDHRGRRIRKLSGGMRRRVVLAQSLLGDPQLLVLDEPTAALDPEQRMRFRELASGLGEERVVLVSTHQTEDVAALCRRVIVMRAGDAVFDGTPAQLCAVARDRVWVADTRDARAQLWWRTAEGRHRHVGDPPPGAQLVEPTIEDGYLLLAGPAAGAELAAA